MNLNSETLSEGCSLPSWPNTPRALTWSIRFQSEWTVSKRNFEPMQHQVEHWRQTQITDERAKLIFYSASIDGRLDAPKSLLSDVHRLYFEPEYPEFSVRTMWSLSNALTSAFKRLDPVPQFKATAKLGEFLNQLPS